MSSLLSASHCFIHIHTHDNDTIYCSWYAYDKEDGAWLSTCVLEAEAVRVEDAPATCNAISKKYKNIVSGVFVPCSNDVLTPAQKRLIRVE